jgi:hypothetical protein
MVAFSRFCLTTKSRTPASSQARINASAPSREIAIGFSLITCLPARAARIPCSGWSPEGVATVTTSIGASASIRA